MTNTAAGKKNLQIAKISFSLTYNKEFVV